MTRAEEIAWAGGVLEAKGYGYTGTKSRSVLRLTDTRPSLLERFQEIVGVGKIYERPVAEGRRRQWRWDLSARSDIADLVYELSDHLSSEAINRFLPK